MNEAIANNIYPKDNIRTSRDIMELTTTITEINGTVYIRVPASMAQYFKIQGKTEAVIEDISPSAAKITFPLQ